VSLVSNIDNIELHMKRAISRFLLKTSIIGEVTIIIMKKDASNMVMFTCEKNG